MSWRKFILLAACFMLLAVQPLQAVAEETNTAVGSEEIESAITVLKEINKIPEQGIPPALLANASGVAIIPNVVKLGFVLGGRRGHGVLMIRDKKGGWLNPYFISFTGGSIGWQIGAQASDVILVFKNWKSIDAIRKGKFTLGVDAAVAAGPVGRQAEAATDTTFKAEIYSFARSRGLFAGVSLEGASLSIEHEDVWSFYRRHTDDINKPPIVLPESVQRLKDTLSAYSSSK